MLQYSYCVVWFGYCHAAVDAGDDDRSGHHVIQALDGTLSPAALTGSGNLRSPQGASRAVASSTGHAEGLPRALLAPGRGQEPFILEPVGGSSKDKDSKRKDSNDRASVSQGSSNKDSNRDTGSDRKRSRDSLLDKKEVKEVARKVPKPEPDNKPVVKEVARKDLGNSRQEKSVSAEPRGALKTTSKADKDNANDKKASPQHTSDKKDHNGCDKAKNPDCDKPQEPPKPCDKDNKPGCKPGCDLDKDPFCRLPIRVFRRDKVDDDDDTGGVQLRTVGEDEEDKDDKDKDSSRDEGRDCGCLKDMWTKLTIDGRVQCPCCICWRPSDGKERCPCPEYN